MRCAYSPAEHTQNEIEHEERSENYERHKIQKVEIPVARRVIRLRHQQQQQVRAAITKQKQTGSQSN